MKTKYIYIALSIVLVIILLYGIYISHNYCIDGFYAYAKYTPADLSGASLTRPDLSGTILGAAILMKDRIIGIDGRGEDPICQAGQYSKITGKPCNNYPEGFWYSLCMLYAPDKRICTDKRPPHDDYEFPSDKDLPTSHWGSPLHSKHVSDTPVYNGSRGNALPYDYEFDTYYNKPYKNDSHHSIINRTLSSPQKHWTHNKHNNHSHHSNHNYSYNKDKKDNDPNSTKYDDNTFKLINSIPTLSDIIDDHENRITKIEKRKQIKQRNVINTKSGKICNPVKGTY